MLQHQRPALYPRLLGSPLPSPARPVDDVSRRRERGDRESADKEREVAVRRGEQRLINLIPAKGRLCYSPLNSLPLTSLRSAQRFHVLEDMANEVRGRVQERASEASRGLVIKCENLGELFPDPARRSGLERTSGSFILGVPFSCSPTIKSRKGERENKTQER